LVSGKRAALYLPLSLVGLALLAGVFAGLYLFEGEAPQADLQGVPDFLSSPVTLRAVAKDGGRGLKLLRVFAVQDTKEKVVFERHYGFKGILNREGVREVEEQVTLEPSKMTFSQGRIVLELRIWDYSMRSAGDGNMTVVRKQATVDTIPPSVQAVSRLHYVDQGGTGFVIYQCSSDTVDSGVMLGEEFYPGFPIPSRKGVFHCCFFPIASNADTGTKALLWARDAAGNKARGQFHFQIKKKAFKKDNILITDGFLDRILPYFDLDKGDGRMSKIEQFLKVNRQLRKENDQALMELGRRTRSNRLWQGVWLRLPNAASMAHFGEIRSYFYNNEKVDEQVHLGVDLASLAGSEVPAANSGVVVYADKLGIYGNSVVIDHGQGVSSLYSHLSLINVEKGAEVKRGEVVGRTGTTGLAGGDHLHFSVMVHGRFVNPVEWWDSKWIEEKIEKRLSQEN
jgi:hypothetical protein